MKRSMAAVAAAFAMAVTPAVHAQSHGGRVIKTKVATYELVAHKDLVVIWVEKPGRGFTTQGTVAGMVIRDSAGQVQDKSKLLPGNGNTLQARGPFRMGHGSRITATVTLPRQPREELTWTMR